MKCNRSWMLCLLLVTAGICVNSAFGSSIYVAYYGSDLTGNGSSGNPYKTIGKGIAMASTADSVKIIAGTYSGDGNRNLTYGGKAITVTSQYNNAADVVIDCGGSPNRAFSFENNESASSVLANVTITNGNVTTRVVNFVEDKNGGAIKIYSSPKISSCIIKNCIARGAGGIFVYKSSGTASPVIDGCTFQFDSAYLSGTSMDGGAIACQLNAAATIQNCTFLNNLASRDGGAIAVGSTVAAAGVSILSCSFSGNKARTDGTGYGGAIRSDGKATIRSCTFVANLAGRGASLYALGNGATVTFERNIVAFNGSPGILDSTIGTVTYSCNDLYQNTGGSVVGNQDTTDLDANTIFQDPLFCDKDGGNYQISSYSPCDEDSSKCNLLIGRYNNACTRCCNKAGDVNNSGFVDLSDLSWLSSYLSSGYPVPPCLEEANCNGIGIVDLSDLSRLTSYLTYGSPAPVCPPQDH